MNTSRELVRNTATAVGDLPHALRFNARSLRAWPVPAAYAHGHKNPVVLVQGVYETWHYLRPLADALNAAGHPVFTVPALGINRRAIPEQARRVAQRILELDLTHVTLVAHSKGGIIGKHVLTDPSVRDRVARVVTVASPFAGTPMAQLGLTPALRAFLPANTVIAFLAAEADINAKIVSIAPSFDSYIPGGSHLEGARNVTLAVAGHFRILHDPSLPALVVEEVGRP